MVVAQDEGPSRATDVVQPYSLGYGFETSLEQLTFCAATLTDPKQDTPIWLPIDGDPFCGWPYNKSQLFAVNIAAPDFLLA